MKNAILAKTTFNSGLYVTSGAHIDSLTVTGSIDVTGATIIGIGGGGGSVTVIDNLTTASSTAALSANMGLVLSNMIKPASTTQAGMIKISPGTAYGTAPTSTDVYTAVSPFSLTNAYNMLYNIIPPIVGNAAFPTASFSDNTVPSVAAVKTAIIANIVNNLAYPTSFSDTNPASVLAIKNAIPTVINNSSYSGSSSDTNPPSVLSVKNAILRSPLL